MLFKKSRILIVKTTLDKTVVIRFKRNLRDFPKKFCCMNSDVCELFDASARRCKETKISQSSKLFFFDKYKTWTGFYELCSYFNWDRSSFIYAPEKTI